VAFKLSPVSSELDGGYMPRLEQLATASPGSYQEIAYGDRPGQFAELWPAPRSGPAPAAVLIHGGYWRERYRLDVMHALAAGLQSWGWAVWNLEYRRTGMPGGGWPGTFSDVAAGIDALAGLAGQHRLDLSRMVIIGHSAGGHLALWAAARDRLPSSWARPVVRPAHVVSLAGVCDLAEAARRRLSDGAVFELLGAGPDEAPEVYRQACPRRLLPLGVGQTVVHGTRDEDVPFTLSSEYAEAAQKAGDRCAFIAAADADHFDMIDPASSAWKSLARLMLPV
jgi:acetyl esterase/lipase